jgi:hypothetical protein
MRVKREKNGREAREMENKEKTASGLLLPSSLTPPLRFLVCKGWAEIQYHSHHWEIAGMPRTKKGEMCGPTRAERGKRRATRGAGDDWLRDEIAQLANETSKKQNECFRA